MIQNYQELLNAFGDMGIVLPPAEQLIHLDDDGIATAAYPRPRLNRPISNITRGVRKGMKVDPTGWAAGPGRRYADKISSLRKSEDRLRGLRHEAIVDDIKAALGLASEIARSRFSQYVMPQTVRGIEVDRAGRPISAAWAPRRSRWVDCSRPRPSPDRQRAAQR